MSDKMTEDQAKTKQCPLIRYCVNPQGAIQDRDHPVYEHSNCQASVCMAWRFDRAEYEHGDALPLGSVPADPGWEQDGETWYCGHGVTGEKRMRWKRALPRTGYCNAFERVRA